VRGRAILVAFTLTTFANAALLFLLEPLFSKLVLPALGGSSAVWTTCMMTYQGILLAGYVYVHLGCRWLGVRRHAAVHLALLGASLFFLPVTLARGWTPPTEGTPVFWLLGLLLASIGLPFFCLSAGAPLVQRWFTGTGHPRRDDPYFLYAASNVGSMAALLAYPLAVEPLLGLRTQALTWSGAFGALGLAFAGCAVALWRAPVRAEDAATPAGLPFPAIGRARRARWLALSAVPSSLLLGVTAHLSTDVAPVPLLWVVPLALYLLTFVWAFAPRARGPGGGTVRAARLLTLPLVVTLGLGWSVSLPVMVVWEFTAFTLIAAICHARLAADRPPVSALTEYYVWVSFGGLLGGAFNALAAPLLFNGLYEYPIALVAGVALALADPAPPSQAGRRARWWRDALVALAVGVLAWACARGLLVRFGPNVPPVNALIGAALGVVLLACSSSAFRLAAACAAVFVALAAARGGSDGEVLRTRSFYGAYRVLRSRADGRPVNVLFHGSTVHGAQFTDPALAREPLTYYARTGPVGDAFAALPARVTGGRVAAVGLGTGSLACYAVPGARWTFVEIDPLMVELAARSGHFDYVARCAPGAGMRVGDARLVLTGAPDASYDLLVLDAFTSDAVPTHLLTREAFGVYARLLAPGGVLLVHATNRYLQLDRVVAGGAAAVGLTGWTRRSAATPADVARLVAPARWIALARDEADLGRLTARPGWHRLDAPPAVWADDFSNVVSILGTGP
jgi:SAM-dependent methyltransferase